MLNWDRGNQVPSFYLAYMKGELEYPKCRVPTLGIWSRGDNYLWEEQMVSSSEFMDAEWRYERLEQGSHWVMLDQPEEINRLFLDWLT
jgi:pimeloyl-ACP methyl ester carboxylesterase